MQLSVLFYHSANGRDLPSIVATLADDELGAKREANTTPLPSSYERAFDAINADRLTNSSRIRRRCVLS